MYSVHFHYVRCVWSGFYNLNPHNNLSNYTPKSINGALPTHFVKQFNFTNMLIFILMSLWFISTIVFFAIFMTFIFDIWEFHWLFRTIIFFLIILITAVSFYYFIDIGYQIAGPLAQLVRASDS